MKIGVISDTHNVLREEVAAHLEGCDAIIHAGDVCCAEGRLHIKFGKGTVAHTVAQHDQVFHDRCLS